MSKFYQWIIKTFSKSKEVKDIITGDKPKETILVEDAKPTTIAGELEERAIEEKVKTETIVEDVPKQKYTTEYIVNNISKFDSRYSINYSDIEALVTELKQVGKTKNFSIFEDNLKDFNLNIWFSRSLDIQEDDFRDVCIVFWLDATNKWNTRLFKWNTNPGLYWLKSPQNPQGTAIIYPSQYRSTHRIRTHRANTSSAHQALCHSQGIVKVFRDNNKDNVLDLDGRIYTNGLGINVHRPTLYTEKTGKVDRSSAGCLIARYRDEFDNKTQNDMTTDTFMGLCRNSRVHWGNKFSITVIDDSMYN